MNNMNVVLFCENKYAIDILYPLSCYAKDEGFNVLWYIHAPKIPIEQFVWKDQFESTQSIQDIYDFKPDVVFVPGNIVPYYLPGVKVQVFHGYAAEKKDHWIIRRYFDLYLTQGPYFTRKFSELALKYKDFEVVETGWTKQDWIKQNINLFDTEKKELLVRHNKSSIVLYAPTFSPSLTSLPKIKKALVELVHNEDIVLIIKLHPLTKSEWVEEYKLLAKTEANIVWAEENNVTKYQLMSDLMISDTSSTVYEFLLLNRPVITLDTIAKDIYWTNITDVQDLSKAYHTALKDPESIQKRQWVINNYDPYMDGKVCERMFDAVKKYIVRHGVPTYRKLNIWRKYTSVKTFGRIKRY